MANRITNGSGRKLDSASIARQWLEMGVRTVPIHPRKKLPSGGEGWNLLRITAETIKDHFKPGDNVGALWGEPSGWIVDVDLDWDEAARIAPHWLPETYVYGRESRPCTHYLIRSEGCKGAKRINPHGRDAIVELRSTLTQSVLPGSIHPDGERYEINEDRKIAPLSSGALAVRVSRIAALALLARAYPEGGGRHDFVHAVAGALLREGWPDDQVRTALRSLIDGAGSKESDAGQRDRTVENTIKKAKDGSNTYGWPTLAAYVTEKKVLDQIKSWLREREIAVAPIRLKRKEGTSEAAIPANLLAAPEGLIADINAWAAKSSPVYHPMIGLAAAITTVAMLTRNSYVVERLDTPLQPYSMVLAPSGSGKETASKVVIRLLARVGLSQFCSTQFFSHHALLDTLEADHIACWLWEEAGAKLRDIARSRGTGPDAQVLTKVIELYGQGHGQIAASRARGQAITAIENPYLCLMATSQPATLSDALSGSHLVTGFINRMMLFDTCDELGHINRHCERMVSTALDTRIRSIREHQAPVGGFTAIKCSNVDWNTIEDYRADARTRQDTTGADLWVRAAQNAIVLAGLAAVSRSATKPAITRADIDWAIRFIDWSIARWMRRIGSGVSENLTEKYSKRLLEIIERAPKLTSDKLKYRKLLKAGLMPRAILTRNTNYLKERERTEYLESLVAGELIHEGERDGVTVYWVRGRE